MSKSKWETGQTFTAVKVEIDPTMKVVKVDKEKLKVLGVSRHYICLGDEYFTTLAISKTFEFSHDKPEKVRIVEYTSDFDIKYFGKFRITLYSQMSEKRIENKINREFNNWLNEKMAAYGNAKKINIKL